MFLGLIWESATSLCMNYMIHDDIIKGTYIKTTGNTLEELSKRSSYFRTFYVETFI